MFKKLLSNLPFNPSLIGQVSFYAKRIKRESAVRRTGLVFLALTMVIQVFATVSPSQASVQGSTNDIIFGGITSPGQAWLFCVDGNKDIGRILDYYGLGCGEVSSGETTYLSSTDYGGQLDSVGRNPVSNPSTRNGRNWDIYTVDIPGVANPLWMKDVQYWDSYGATTYKVLKMTNRYGQTIYMMYDCGNLVTIGHYSPPPPPPPPPPQLPPPPPVLPAVITCSSLSMNVEEGAKIKLGKTVTVRGQAAGKNLPAGKTADLYYEFVNAASNKVLAKDQALGVAFQNGLANDSAGHNFSSNTAGQYLIRLIVKYDSTKTASGSATGSCLKHITVEQPCEGVISNQDLERCLDKHKSAQNITQQLPNAQSKPAQAGDTIEYSLSVKNTGKVTVPKFMIKENVNDILDYANITDLHGGQLDKDNYLFWPATDIKAGQTITKQLTVKIKSPVPSTTVSSSDPAHFDCIITNTYGDTVTIHIQCAVVKTVETTTTLPNTGPGTSLLIGFGVTVVVAYFFARSRLFASELDIVREEYINSGAA